MDIIVDDIISGPLNSYLINMSISNMKMSCKRLNGLLKYLTYNSMYEPLGFASYDLKRIDLFGGVTIIYNLEKYSKLAELNIQYISVSGTGINLINLPNLTKIHLNQTWKLYGKSNCNCLKLNWFGPFRRVDVSQIEDFLVVFRRLKVLKLLYPHSDNNNFFKSNDFASGLTKLISRGVVNSIEGLPSLKKLKIIRPADLRMEDLIRSYHPGLLTGLENLNLVTLYCGQQVQTFPASLTALEISGRHTHIFQRLPNLRKLKAVGCGSEILQELECIEELDTLKSKSMESFTLLCMTNLKVLKITGNVLTNHEINMMTQLEKLKLNDCTKLRDLMALTRLKNLELCGITKIKMLPVELKHLTYNVTRGLNLVDNGRDLSVLVSLNLTDSSNHNGIVKLEVLFNPEIVVINSAIKVNIVNMDKCVGVSIRDEMRYGDRFQKNISSRELVNLDNFRFIGKGNGMIYYHRFKE